MVNETRKILNDYSLAVTATTVRVPVFYGHSESVNIERKENNSRRGKSYPLTVSRRYRYNNPGEKQYPLPIHAAVRMMLLLAESGR